MASISLSRRYLVCNLLNSFSNNLLPNPQYISRGSLEWVDGAGRAVRGADRTYILEQLDTAEFETKFDFKIMRRTAKCSFKENNPLTWDMRQWFLREWNDPDVQAAKGDLHRVIHPSEPPQGTEAAADEADFLDDELEPVSEYGARGFIRLLREWLQGGISED